MALLRTEHLTKRFGGLLALNDLSVEIAEGRVTGLIGPNGSGKTTFINTVTGVYKPDMGSVFFKGKPIGGAEPHVIARVGIARTYQRIRLFERMTALQNVLVARHVWYRSNMAGVLVNSARLRGEEADHTQEAMALLELVGLRDKADSLPGSLPYGHRRNLEIARALALKPSLLLLDEPAAGMNREEFLALQRLILRLKREGMTILLVEHTMELVESVADHVVVLNFGQKLAEGSFDLISKDKNVVEAYLGKEEL